MRRPTWTSFREDVLGEVAMVAAARYSMLGVLAAGTMELAEFVVAESPAVRASDNLVNDASYAATPTLVPAGSGRGNIQLVR